MPGLVSTLLNQAYSMPSREVHTFLQVTEQVWQPMHLSRLRTIPICALTFISRSCSPQRHRGTEKPETAHEDAKTRGTYRSNLFVPSCFAFPSSLCVSVPLWFIRLSLRPARPSSPPRSSCARSRTRRGWSP